MNCGLTGKSARLLADWYGLRSVRWLQIGGNGLTDADANQIRNSPQAGSQIDVGVRP
jgi:hypothetical protein